MESLAMEHWEIEENKRIESQSRQTHENETSRKKHLSHKSVFPLFLPNHANIEVFVQSIAMAFAAVFLVVVFRYYPIKEYFTM